MNSVSPSNWCVLLLLTCGRSGGAEGAHHWCCSKTVVPLLRAQRGGPASRRGIETQRPACAEASAGRREDRGEECVRSSRVN